LVYFKNREEAGQQLARKIRSKKGQVDVVLGIARGGVPIAYQLAKELDSKMAVLITRKIPIPWSPEAGFGAVAEDGTMVINHPLTKHLGLKRGQINYYASKVKEEIARRKKVYRSKLDLPLLLENTAIVTDDGLASGYTMLAAYYSIQKLNPKKIIVAVPVASLAARQLLEKEVKELEILHTDSRRPFAIADFYGEWDELTDDDIVNLISQATQEGLINSF
jgi:predicted phosphoribosyltransferase